MRRPARRRRRWTPWPSDAGRRRSSPPPPPPRRGPASPPRRAGSPAAAVAATTTTSGTSPPCSGAREGLRQGHRPDGARGDHDGDVQARAPVPGAQHREGQAEGGGAQGGRARGRGAAEAGGHPRRAPAASHGGIPVHLLSATASDFRSAERDVSSGARPPATRRTAAPPPRRLCLDAGGDAPRSEAERAVSPDGEWISAADVKVRVARAGAPPR